jgi:hypothetical protein
MSSNLLFLSFFLDQVMVSDDEQDAISTDPDELLDSDDSEGMSGDEEDIFRNLLARAGFHLSYGDNPPLLLDPSQLQVTLREKLLMDAGAIAAFLTGLRVYLDDPAKVKKLLLPTKLSTAYNNAGSKKGNAKGEATSPSLMNLLMGVKVLQQAIADLLLDIMVECCQPSNNEEFVDVKPRTMMPDASNLGLNKSFSWRSLEIATPDSAKCLPIPRLDSDHDGMMATQAVRNNEVTGAGNQISKGSIEQGSFCSESNPRETFIAKVCLRMKWTVCLY